MLRSDPPATYSPSPAQKGAHRAEQQGAGSKSGPAPHVRQIAGGHDRIRRQPVDLRLVQQQGHGPPTPDAVARVLAVEPGFGNAVRVQGGEPDGGTFAQLVDVAELDGL